MAENEQFTEMFLYLKIGTWSIGIEESLNF